MEAYSDYNYDEYDEYDIDDIFREIEHSEEQLVGQLLASKKTEDNVVEILTCPVCFEFPKEVLILTCQHTLCATCAQQIATPTIVCPICRQVTVKEWGELPCQKLPKVSSCLLFAAGNGYLKLMKLLLENDGNPDTGDYDGITLLQTAIKKENEEMVELLLRFKANPEQYDFGDEQIPPLFLACESGNLAIVRLLLDHGASTDRDLIYTGFVIHAAAIGEHLSVVEELVKRDPKLLDAMDDTGNTALHVACSRGDRALMELLLKLGAKLDLRNDDNEKPFDLLKLTQEESKFRPRWKFDLSCLHRVLNQEFPKEKFDS